MGSVRRQTMDGRIAQKDDMADTSDYDPVTNPCAL
jgi:hypothetical protein